MSEVPARSANRPNIMTRIVAGIGVVLAALVPIAALVFFILHVFTSVSFGQLA